MASRTPRAVVTRKEHTHARRTLSEMAFCARAARATRTGHEGVRTPASTTIAWKACMLGYVTMSKPSGAASIEPNCVMCSTLRASKSSACTFLTRGAMAEGLTRMKVSSVLPTRSDFTSRSSWLSAVRICARACATMLDQRIEHRRGSRKALACAGWRAGRCAPER